MDAIVSAETLNAGSRGDLIGFIHSCTMKHHGTEILKRIVSKLIQTQLLPKFRYLIIHNVGMEIFLADLFISVPPNVVLINSSGESETFELLTLQKLHFLAHLHPEAKFLYLHTKGVSYPIEHPYTSNIQDWSDFMLYNLIDHHPTCCQLLDWVEVLGSNYRTQYFDACNNPNHFSGNYWWARGSYITRLSSANLKSKYDAEWWLFQANPTFIHLSKSRTPERHYEVPFPPQDYVEIVDARMEEWKKVMLNSKKTIYYGAGDTWIDVTLICQEQLSINGILTIPVGDMERNQIFGDPLVGTVKAIRIGNLLFPYTEDIKIPW